MKIKLQYGKDHAKINCATHHRYGDIYKLSSNKVFCWGFGEWCEVDNCYDVESWLEELTEIDWEIVE